MNLFRLVLALIAFAVAGAASAGSVSLTCTAPTQRTDGSALTNLAGYRFAYGVSPTALGQTVQVANPATCAATVANLAPGTWYFSVKAYDANGVESAASSTVSAIVAAPPAAAPMPPSGLAATALTAYVIKQTPDNIALVAAGKVPATTQCEPTDGVIDNGKVYSRVPAAAVTWAGSVRSVFVVAACS